MSVPHRESPAPWKVYRTKDGTPLGVGDKHSGGVTDYQGGFWGSGANKRANIHLVAAAPELYAALYGCLEHMEWSTEQGKAAYQMAVDALAKARGEAL